MDVKVETRIRCVCDGETCVIVWLDLMFLTQFRQDLYQYVSNKCWEFYWPRKYFTSGSMSEYLIRSSSKYESKW